MGTVIDSEGPLRAWLQDAETAVWDTPQSIRDVYRNASIIANNRVVIVEAQEDAGGDAWIWVSARTSTAAEELNSVLNSDVEFEWCSDDWPQAG